MPMSTARIVTAPRTKPMRKRAIVDGGAGTGPGGLARARRSSDRSSLLETLGAVDRPIGTRLERDLTRLAAVAADDLVHALRAGRCALGLGASAAVRASLRLVEQALLGVEVLLAG